MASLYLKNNLGAAGISADQGAVVTDFKVGSQDILSPDGIIATPKGPKRRGGIPLLFPNADPLTEPTDEFNLPQHGFARDLPWEVREVDQNRAVLGLRANEETRVRYPYDFELILALELVKAELRYTLTIKNTGAKAMPIAPGLHPYFYVPNAQKANITTNIPNFDPKTYTWNETLAFPAQDTVEVEVPGIGTYHMQSSPEFKQLMVWSEPDMDYVCFEPWVGPRNALLHTEQRLQIEPEREIKLYLKLWITDLKLS